MLFSCSCLILYRGLFLTAFLLSPAFGEFLCFIPLLFFRLFLRFPFFFVNIARVIYFPRLFSFSPHPRILSIYLYFPFCLCLFSISCVVSSSHCYTSAPSISLFYFIIFFLPLFFILFFLLTVLFYLSSFLLAPSISLFCFLSCTSYLFSLFRYFSGQLLILRFTYYPIFFLSPLSSLHYPSLYLVLFYLLYQLLFISSFSSYCQTLFNLPIPSFFPCFPPPSFLGLLSRPVSPFRVLP